MKPSVLIGALVRPNVAALRQFKRLRLGDAVHTFMPSSMPEAIDIARYCRENQIYLLFWDLLPRGTLRTREIVREQELAKHHLAKPNVPAVLDCKSNMDAIIDEAGSITSGASSSARSAVSSMARGRIQKNGANCGVSPTSLPPEL